MPSSRAPLFLSPILGWLLASAAIPGAPISAAPLTRIAATSLTLPATAPAYSYTTEPAFGGAKFFEPTQVVFAPGETTRAFVVEREGRIAVVRDTTAASPTREVFLDLTARVGDGGSDHGLLSLAFHPQFATNGWFYVWHSMGSCGKRYNRLARYTRSLANPAIAGRGSELPLLDVFGRGGRRVALRGRKARCRCGSGLAASRACGPDRRRVVVPSAGTKRPRLAVIKYHD